MLSRCFSQSYHQRIIIYREIPLLFFFHIQNFVKYPTITLKLNDTGQLEISIFDQQMDTSPFNFYGSSHLAQDPSKGSGVDHIHDQWMQLRSIVMHHLNTYLNINSHVKKVDCVGQKNVFTIVWEARWLIKGSQSGQQPRLECWLGPMLCC